MAANNRPPVRLRLRLTRPLEALVAYTTVALVRLMPFAWASAVGGWLGRTIGPYLRVTDVARRNLARAFPEKSAAEIEAIIRRMWDNLGRVAFEYSCLDRVRIFAPDSHVEVVGAENIDALKNDGEPGIFFSGHFANWELSALSVVRRGLPIHLIFRAPNNPLMRRLYDLRYPGDGELIPKGAKGARRALQLLGRGEHLGILLDQKMNDGIPVPFLGRDAMTAPALAQFALKFDCPVVPVRPERLGGTRFRITFFPPYRVARSGDRQADIAAATAKANAFLEDWVRERPDQWLWLHNRWPD